MPREDAPQPEPHQPPAQTEAPSAPAAEAHVSPERAEAPRAEAPAAPEKAEAPRAPKAEAPAAPAATEAPKAEAPKAPERPKFVPGIRVVQTKAEVEASEEARRRQLAQQRQQRQANPQGPYGRPANPQGPYGRPANPQGPYGRPANPQGPYGRPANPQGPYGRPANPQGPYGRPAGTQQGSYGRPAAPGQQRPAPGGASRPQQGGGRFGGNAGGARGGFGRRMSDLAPSVEKERVSNYDPNKKQYVRQNDPERAARTRRNKGVNINGGLDDEIVRGKRKKKQQASAPRPEPVKIEKAFMTAETITVRDLSERIGKPAGEIIKKLMMLGIIATINNELDFDTAQLVCSEFGVELEMKLAETAEDALKNEDVEDSEEDLLPRPPVVTIMGHVDHGKTSLLDYIRKTRVTAGEAGGITQHIGAYTVEVRGQKITFLDTPGHEAFTAMRARGAQATDIAILVVAADDGVMPQTIEAINHAKAANVEIIVAINKIDKPGANIDRVKQELSEYELIPEDWGGSTVFVPVSAKTHEGIEDLLEMILLTSEVAELKANPNRRARGLVIEAQLDKGKGPVATILVQKGTLHVGDFIAAGASSGKVRAMMDDKGRRVKEAGPSTPVEILGLSDVPNAGEILVATENDKEAKHFAATFISENKNRLLEETKTKMSLDDLFNQIQEGNLKELNIVVKADVQGSVEAVKQSLVKLSNEEVVVKIIHGGVGAINESDVTLASASNAIIIGFNVRPDATAKAIAEQEGVDLRLYRVIYQAIEDVEAAMKGMLDPVFEEKVIGHAEVRQTFKASGVGTIAGCYILDGMFQRGCSARITREGAQIFDGPLASLKRFKDDVKEVKAGYECGLVFEGFNDIQELDQVEAYTMVEVPR